MTGKEEAPAIADRKTSEKKFPTRVLKEWTTEKYNVARALASSTFLRFSMRFDTHAKLSDTGQYKISQY